MSNGKSLTCISEIFPVKGILEIICYEITSAESALQSVADRIVFAAERAWGGTTPNIDEFRYLKHKYTKPIYVQISPQSEAFLSSDTEFEKMKRDLLAFKDAGAAGFVFGILNRGNQIDLKKNKELMALADPLPCTFSKAADHTPVLKETVEQLVRLGFHGVITSGGKRDILKSKAELKELVDLFSHRINIMINGNVSSKNISEIKIETGARFFHSTAIPPYESYVNEDEIKKLKMQL